MADVIKLKIDLLAHELQTLLEESEQDEIIKALENIVRKFRNNSTDSWLVSGELFRSTQNKGKCLKQRTNYGSREQHQDKNFKCQKCEKVFQNKFNLKRHQNNKVSCDGKVLEQETRGAVCPLCSSIKSSKEELKSHMEKHSEQLNRLKCQTCNSQYYRSRDLRQHLARKKNCKPPIMEQESCKGIVCPFVIQL